LNSTVCLANKVLSVQLPASDNYHFIVIQA